MALKKKVKPILEAKAIPKEYYPTPPELEVYKKACEDRKLSAYPRLKVVDGAILIDHPDREFGELLMLSALGSWDYAFMHSLLWQLGQSAIVGDQISVVHLNFLLAYIVDRKPRDQTEAMLAAQMAVVHLMFMKVTRQFAKAENLIEQEYNERTLNKFLRTFTMQMDAFNRHRFGSEQKITVQHVSVSEGGQAIVGNVTQHSRGRASETAPLTLTHSKESAMEVIGKPVARSLVKRKPGK